MRRMAIAAALLVAAACTGRYVRATSEERFEPTAERIARGRYLVDQVAGCGACHTSRPGGDMAQPEGLGGYLAGGNWLQEGKLGVWVPNLTSDPEAGLGRWTDDEIARAIRDGVRPDGSFLNPVMPFGSFRHLSDEDVRSIVAYLRTVPAAPPATERREAEVPFMMGLALGLGAAMNDPAVAVASPPADDAVARGEYLAHAAHCGDCHSRGRMGVRDRDDEFLGGATAPSRLPFVGEVWATNLTGHGSGIGDRTDEEVKLALRTGLRFDGRPMAPPMSWYIPHLALWEERDLDDLVAFLRSLEKVERQVPPRVLAPEMAEVLGG